MINCINVKNKWGYLGIELVSVVYVRACGKKLHRDGLALKPPAICDVWTFSPDSSNGKSIRLES